MANDMENRGNADELDHRLISHAPLRDGLEALRTQRAVEAKLFGTTPAPIRLARYVLLAPIAAGGGGIVYTAYDPELDRKVAIKLMHGGVPGEDDSAARARMLREAQAMARLAHPNVVAAFDVGTYGPQDVSIPGGARPNDVPPRGVFIVMELVEGQDLRAWLSARPRSIREIVAVFTAAGRGLVAAHAAGLVHRDFKPANVVIGHDGRVRVIDFGLARGPLGESSVSELESLPAVSTIDDPTPIGTVMGTPPYMSPEQRAGQVVDPRSDQYSFCVALYESLHGERPRVDGTKDDRLLAPTRARRIPRRLERALARGLRSDPTQRFPDMAALLGEISRDPARRLALGVAGVAIAAVISAGAFALHDRGQARVRHCDEQSGEADALWRESVRDDIRSAFATTGKPFAEAAWTAVDRELTDYVGRWGRARRSTCLAELDRSDGRTAITARQLLCLDRRLARFEGLIRLLRSADAAVVERSIQAATALPAIEDCTAAPRPRDTAVAPQRDDLFDVERELADLAVLVAAARFEAAGPVADRALRSALELDDETTSARAWLEVARLRRETGDGQAAENGLRNALHAAERAGDDEVAVDAMIDLVLVVGDDRARFDEGLDYAAHAQARIEGAGLADAFRIRLAYHLGRVHESAGRYDEALPPLRTALARAELVHGENHPLTADIVNLIGVVLDRQWRNLDAIEHYRRALAIRRTLFGDDHPKVGNALANVAIMLGRLGDYRGSATELRRAVTIMERGYGERHPQVAWFTNELAHALGDLGRHEESLALHIRALEVREAALGTAHPEYVSSLDSMAQRHLAMGHGEEALKWAERAVVGRRKLGGEALGRSLTTLSWCLLALDRNAEAFAGQKEALVLLETALGSEHPRVGSLLSDMAEGLLGENDRRQASALAQRALAIAEKTGQPARTRARARFLFAQAISTEDRPRAIALADEARQELVSTGLDGEGVARVEAWLSANR